MQTPPNANRQTQPFTDARSAGTIPIWAGKTSTQAKSFEAVFHETPAPKTVTQDTGNTAAPSSIPADDFGFLDLVDMINPLQHIPVVNLFYRAVTGDTIKPIGKILGGAVFGGPVGASSGLVDAIITQETGQDMAGTVLSLVRGPDEARTAPQGFKIARTAYERITLDPERTAGTIARYA